MRGAGLRRRKRFEGEQLRDSDRLCTGSIFRGPIAVLSRSALAVTSLMLLTCAPAVAQQPVSLAQCQSLGNDATSVAAFAKPYSTAATADTFKALGWRRTLATACTLAGVWQQLQYTKCNEELAAKKADLPESCKQYLETSKTRQSHPYCVCADTYLKNELTQAAEQVRAAARKQR